MTLTREQILAHQKLKQKKVDFPALGGEMLFQEMGADDWENFDRKAPNYSIRLFIAGAIDEKGIKLFSDKDVNHLAGKGAHLIEKGARAVLELCGVLPESEEEILKNSKPTPPAPKNGESPSA